MGPGRGINPHTLTRIRLAQAEQFAKVEHARREHLNRLNRPVWKKVNRLELTVGLGLLALILAWMLYLAIL